MAALRSPLEEAGDEDWVLLSPEDKQPSHRSVYLEFQLRTRLGTLSFTASPAANSKPANHQAQTTMLQQEQSPLYRLPAELRLDIFERVFSVPNAGAEVPLRRHSSPRTTLALLLVCRRALAEAEELFYSLNRLSTEHPRDCWASLGPGRREAITAFVLPVSSAGSALDGLQQLRGFTNLKSLQIRRKQSVRFLDVSSWAIMASQLVAEIGAMSNLVEVDVVTPEAAGLTESERVRKEKLDGIDRRICDATRREERQDIRGGC